MRRLGVLVVFCAAAFPAFGRNQGADCGTTAETAGERLFLHRQALRARRGARPLAATASANRDAGNIALIEDADGVIVRQNEFNLELHTLRFTPGPGGYRYEIADGGYDDAAASGGDPLAALDDDDSRLVQLPFAFPFFGASYRALWVNSDGNLTFQVKDDASTDRSLGRMTSGPPRIAPLFDDLNPAETAGGVRVASSAGRVVISWVAVPEYTTAGGGPRQSFQATLYSDGRIEFAYQAVHATAAVVGIAPGGPKSPAALVDYRKDPSGVYGAGVAERFGGALAVDIVTVAQRFYQSHEDAYDYLVVFNNLDIPALTGGVIAYESTVRSRGTGYGVAPRDDGGEYGSASRLQAVLNMGPLSQFPADPNATVPARATAGDTPLTTIAHEAGHLFLAYASVPDRDDPTAAPMLGFQKAHWSFLFNSEASLLEGERIVDRGPSVSPRFTTAETVQGYSPLDQYLMGWRAPEEAPDTFLVTGAPSFYQSLHPVSGLAFDGDRRDIAIGEIVSAMGRRTPDHTIAQHRFRFAFLLVTAPGANPSAEDLAKVESFRSQFDTFFSKASTGRAAAETTLARSLKLSLFPYAGLARGSSGTATLEVETAPAADLRIDLRAPGGHARLPASVTIPAGAKSASLGFSGGEAGVEEVTATPADPAYETAFARVQVAGATELKLTQVGADPVTVQLSDANGLVYAGTRIVASAAAGDSVIPSEAATDAAGRAVFHWSPAAGPVSELRLSVADVPAVSLAVRSGSAVPAIAAIVNAASGEEGAAAGGLAAIYGSRLAGSSVTLDGAALDPVFASDSLIEVFVPASTLPGPATLVVTAPSGERAEAAVGVKAVQPGIFGATVTGDLLVLYATGLGPVRTEGDGLAHTVVLPVVFVGAVPLTPVFSGLSPLPGVNQVNVRLPPGLSPGSYPVLLSASLAHSNAVSVTVK